MRATWVVIRSAMGSILKTNKTELYASDSIATPKRSADLAAPLQKRRYRFVTGSTFRSYTLCRGAGFRLLPQGFPLYIR